MTVIKTLDIRQALTKKGFRLDHTHHDYYWFFYKGRKATIRTFVSHGEKEYKDPLITKVRKQMKLDTKKQFLEFINCPMGQREYTEHLLNKPEMI